MGTVRTVIKGCGGYLPERVLTNADLAKMVDTSDAWITERTGIKERRIAAEGELTSTMVVAGMTSRRNSPWARPSSSQSEMSVTNIRVRTTCSRPAPRRFSAASMFRKHCAA